MASVNIPIISEFDAKGTQKAIKEFQSLEGASAKAQFAIKKAAIPAAAAITAVAGALTLATKAAVEDEAEQAQLALTMQNVTGATNSQVAAVEKMISSMSRASGTADSELRPAFASLLRGTKDVEEATTALALAQDIAVGSNKSLGEVSDALSKAFGGNMKGLQALSPEIKTMIKDGASLDEVMNVLGGTFGGAAATAANTAAGRFKILSNTLAETKESIGAALLPVLEKTLPVLQKFADWAQNNPKAFLAVASAITAISVAILAVNFAMSLNPFTAIAAGVAALVVGVIYAYNKFETFRTVVNAVLNNMIGTFENFANAWISTINVIIRGMNLISPFTDISTIPQLNLPTIGGSSSTSSGDRGGAAREGGIDQVLASLPSMPTTTSPLSAGGGGGGGAGGGGATGQGGMSQEGFGQGFLGGGINAVDAPLSSIGPSLETLQGFMSGGFGQDIKQEITVNVNGGLASSSDIGSAVVNAIRAFNRTNGPADIAVA